MASFSATDAAFEGFRLTKEQPKTLLIWAAFNLVISIVTLVLLIGVGGEALAAMMALESAGSDPDPAQAMATFSQLGVVYALLLPIGLITQSMLGAAVYRAVLRPQEGGVGFLKLGGDELRLVALSIIYFFLMILGVVGVTLVASLVVGLAGRAIGGPAAALLGVGVGLFVSGLMVFVVVRLSLAGVITYARKKISVFDSWGLTRGHFWQIIGTYVLTLAAVIVVMMLSLIVFAALAAVATGGDLAAVGKVFSPDFTSLASYMTPTMIAYTVFGAVLNAIYYAAIFAPHAIIYRGLSGDVEANAEVFA